MATRFVLCHSTCLHFFFSLFPVFHHSLPLCFLSTAWLCWHLHSSVLEWKKDQRFFSTPVVLSLTHFSPRPVSCVFSPISGILTSPPSMWVNLMCAAGLSCRAGSSPLFNFGGAVCACGLWVVCLCVFISVCAVLVIHTVWILMKDHNPIITTARDVCLNDSCFLCLCICVCTTTTKHEIYLQMVSFFNILP